MRHILLTILLLLSFLSMSAQTHEKSEEVIQTFRDTRIINSHSVETLPARKLDFRIAHRLVIWLGLMADGLLFMG